MTGRGRERETEKERERGVEERERDGWRVHYVRVQASITKLTSDLS